MKLPVKQILNKNKKHYQIIDANNKIVVTDVVDLKDALEIETALNNHNNILFLLNKCFLRMENETFLVKEIKQQLEELLKTLNR